MRRSDVLGAVADIPSKREAQQLLDDLLRRVNGGEYRPQAIWTFGRFVQDRWKPDVYPTLKFSSKKFYDNMVNTHLMPVFGEKQLRLISRESVRGFLAAKAQGDSSWKTVKHIRTVFGSILESAVRDDLLPSNPVRRHVCRDVPRSKKRLQIRQSPYVPCWKSSLNHPAPSPHYSR